jgi:gamma-glutamyltranspeptidase / glutathione hydrolase / leukotriene-C4 hydrolase
LIQLIFSHIVFHRSNASRKKAFIAVLLAIFAVVVVIVVYSFLLKKDDKEPVHLHHGAVATNGIECAAIGESILRRQGSVADAAIAVMLCEGVTCESEDV